MFHIPKEAKKLFLSRPRPRPHPPGVVEYIILLKEATINREHHCHEEVYMVCNIL